MARNEAAYIAEWVHHHLYFGFAPIEIAVNRSTDASAKIVAKIAEQDDRVQLIDGDLLDRPGHDIQRSNYRAARARLRKRLDPWDYIAYFDIDEFWTPTDFTSSILTVLGKAGHPDITSFNWFVLASDTRPFAPSFRPSFFGYHHVMVKSVIRIGLPAVVGAPTCRPLWPVPNLVPDGPAIANRDRARTVALPTQFGPAYVLHREHRSEVEYLAILGRGNPMPGAGSFKTNRAGYFATDRPNRRHKSVDLAETVLRPYLASRRRFLERLDADAYLPKARAGVLARSRAVLEGYHALSEEEKQLRKRQFRRVDFDRALNMLDRLQARFGTG
ncbi:MAG: glycosyltransferase family 2 protein [Pseudomonadota bacterium]